MVAHIFDIDANIRQFSTRRMFAPKKKLIILYRFSKELKNGNQFFAGIIFSAYFCLTPIQSLINNVLINFASI
jgi:hypothetical protein